MIPSAFRANCEFCKTEIDTRAEGTHQHTSGWVKVRSGGGGHGISLAQRDSRWACGYCIDRAVRGFLKQESLL
jgi:hypothetical protein